MVKAVANLERSIKNWWAFEVLGTVLIVMSILVFSRPIEAYVGLVVYFVLTFVVSGILRIIFSLTNRDTVPGWGWYLGGGIFDLIIGLLLASRMEFASAVLPFYVGFYLLFSSVSAIGKSFDMRNFGFVHWTWLLCAGIAGLFFSGLILFNPVLGAASIVTWTALAFLCIGIFYVALGFRLHRVQKIDLFGGPTVQA